MIQTSKQWHPAPHTPPRVKSVETGQGAGRAKGVKRQAHRPRTKMRAKTRRDRDEKETRKGKHDSDTHEASTKHQMKVKRERARARATGLQRCLASLPWIIW